MIHEQSPRQTPVKRLSWLCWVLLLVISAATSCSLFAPTDEELFGNKSSGGAAPVAGTGAR